MNRQTRHWRHISFVGGLCILVGFVCPTGYSQRKSNSNQPVDQIKRTIQFDSLNYVVLDNLRSKRIVMIGDAYHEHGYYMRMVTGVLDQWLDQLEKEKTSSPSKQAGQGIGQLVHLLPKKLILFVERDSIGMSAQNRYMQTGDIQSWLEYTFYHEYNYGRQPGGTSIDIIEYLNTLKRIQERVSRLNAHNVPHPYDFRIIGAESTPPFKPPPLTRDTAAYREQYRQLQKTKFEWFAYKRDELSSDNVRKVLKENPDYKALIFYGTAHLFRGRQDKAVMGGGTPLGIDSAYGYFIASYLDQYFSRDSVSIFLPYNRPETRNPEFQELEHRQLSSDYHIFCRPIPPVPSPLEIVNCQATLRAFFELMKRNGSGKSDEEQMYFRSYARRLGFQLQRSYLNSKPDARSWLDSMRKYTWDSSQTAIAKRVEVADKLIKNFDAIKNIDSLEKWMTLPMRDTSYYLTMLASVLANLPSQGDTIEKRQIPHVSLNEETRALIHRGKEDLVEYFLVNLLWIGTPDEKNRARKELMEKTKLKFTTEQEWSDWWRSKYH
jgi:hypothetical protein